MGGMGEQALTPGLPRRSWNCDLDTLTRLHRCLRDLDVTGGADGGDRGKSGASDDDGDRDRTGDDRADRNGADLDTGGGGADAAADGGGEPGPTVRGRGDALAREARLRAMLAGRMNAARELAAGGQPASPAAGEPSAGGPGVGGPLSAPLPPAPLPPAPLPLAPAPAPVLAGSVIAVIRDTFRYIDAAGDRAVRFFYGQLFARQPRLREMFPPAMDEHRDRLFRVLAHVVAGLSEPERLSAYLSQLGHENRKFLGDPDLRQAAGAALIATLRAFAGPAFTAQAERAWTQVYLTTSALLTEAHGSGPASWPARVVAVDRRSDSVAVLTIAPDQPLPYLPGQYVTVRTPRWPGVWRPYSVACRPREDGLLVLHVRAVPGGWVSSALVHHSPPGTPLEIGPPLGSMTLCRAGEADLLCVAGGTGLSPVKAIIEQELRSGAADRRVYLYYGARHRSGLYDLTDLWRLAGQHKRFRLIPATSDDPAFHGMQGRIGRIAASCLPHTACEAFVAGPTGMVRDTIQALGQAGLGRERIHCDQALLA